MKKLKELDKDELEQQKKKIGQQQDYILTAPRKNNENTSIEIEGPIGKYQGTRRDIVYVFINTQREMLSGGSKTVFSADSYFISRDGTLTEESHIYKVPKDGKGHHEAIDRIFSSRFAIANAIACYFCFFDIITT